MRDGKVFLPVGKVSKEAIRGDLSYFGFEDVPQDAIHVTYATPEAIDHIKQIDRMYQTRKKAFDKDTTMLEVAYKCYCNYRDHQQLVTTVFSSDNDGWHQKFLQVKPGGVQRLQHFLRDFGFECTDCIVNISHPASPVKITCKKLDL